MIDMYTDNRNAYRQLFFTVWQKHKQKLLLEPTEAQLVDVILQHPEYHHFLENPKQYENQEFTLEENPFFHMSLHLAIREQIATTRPAGIEIIYQRLISLHHDRMVVEHLMMECLAHFMYLGQQNGRMPSDKAYLQALKAIS
jgi:hypothetical protein